jgi:hypothetical protein
MHACPVDAAAASGPATEELPTNLIPILSEISDHGSVAAVDATYKELGSAIGLTETKLRNEMRLVLEQLANDCHNADEWTRPTTERPSASRSAASFDSWGNVPRCVRGSVLRC